MNTPSHLVRISITCFTGMLIGALAAHKLIVSVHTSETLTNSAAIGTVISALIGGMFGYIISEYEHIPRVTKLAWDETLSFFKSALIWAKEMSPSIWINVKKHTLPITINILKFMFKALIGIIELCIYLPLFALSLFILIANIIFALFLLHSMFLNHEHLKELTYHLAAFNLAAVCIGLIHRVLANYLTKTVLLNALIEGIIEDTKGFHFGFSKLLNNTTTPVLIFGISCVVIFLIIATSLIAFIAIYWVTYFTLCFIRFSRSEFRLYCSCACAIGSIFVYMSPEPLLCAFYGSVISTLFYWISSMRWFSYLPTFEKKLG